MDEREYATLVEKLTKTENDVILLSKVLDSTNKHHRFILIAISILLALSLLVNSFTVGAFVWYENQFDYTYTYKKVGDEINQEVNGDNSNINNIGENQYNDNAVHNETE